ncbi:MAG: hypothetical protein JW751_11620 [Polyangiaceae bacterium]|nr:hypothetical protein [Polyangiaceae bacterium]
MRVRHLMGFVSLLGTLVLACGGKDDDDDGEHTGGTVTGGRPTGGSATGGVANGGVEDGGVEEGGGAPSGGAITGGIQGGGVATGGADGGGADGGGAPSGGTPGGDGGTAGSGGEGGAAGGAGIEVEIGTCESFESCGGDLEGTWAYSAGCIDPTTLAVDVSVLTTVCPESTQTIAVNLWGTITFTDSAVVRNGGWESEVVAHIPDSCSALLSLAGGCSGIESYVAVAAPNATTTCNEVTDGCDCTLSVESRAWAAGSYTVEEDVLTLSDGRTFDYCVRGDTLEYTETSEEPEPGTFQLVKE